LILPCRSCRQMRLSYRFPRRPGICAAAVTTICGLSLKIWPESGILAILPYFAAVITLFSTPPGRRAKESGKLKSSSRYLSRLIIQALQREDRRAGRAPHDPSRPGPAGDGRALKTSRRRLSPGTAIYKSLKNIT